MAAGGAGTEQGAQLLREYVYQALISKASGTDVARYTNFVREFVALRKKVGREPSGTGHLMLANFIGALRSCVSVVQEHTHDAILCEVLNIRLWETAPMVRSAVLDLVSTLVVVNTAFTHSCLRLLVSTLLPPPAPPSPEAHLGAWQPTEEETMVQAAVTGALTTVLDHVPTAPVSLMQLVSAHLPHKLRDRSSQCLYFSALFRLAESRAGEPVRDAVLAVAVEHLLSLDVDIRWEDIVEAQTAETAEEVEGEEEEDVEDIFQLEGMSELDLNATPEELERLKQERLAAQAAAGPRGGWEGAASGHPTADATHTQQAAGPATVDETANKLDSLMELTLLHLERQCLASLEHTWRALLVCFERTILNTHRSKFSQFLVFHVCSKHPDPCVRVFVELLLARLHDERLPSITRSACAAYLASFLARCAAVNPGLVLHAVDALTRFAEQYLATAAITPTSLDGARRSGGGAAEATDLTTRHQVFYAAVQAILYVVCYHLDTLLHQHTHHHRQTLSEAIRTLLTGRVLPVLSHPVLQPLAVCLPSVVAEFKTQLAHHDIADLTAATTMTQESRGTQRPLEMFFPFDPYLLRRSARLLDLEHTYVTWQRGKARGAGRAADASQSDEEGEEEDEEEEVVEGPQAAGRKDEEEEDGDLELASSDAEDSSSDTEEDEGSLRGSSLTSNHIHSLKPPLAALQRRVRSEGHRPGGLAAAATGSHAAAWGQGLHHGKLGVASMATSYDPMGTSYGGMGIASSMGDVTPTGTSPPVVVDYYSGPGRSVSPMQMTPQFHAHMDAVPSRLAAGRV